MIPATAFQYSHQLIIAEKTNVLQGKYLLMKKDLKRIKGGYRPQKHFQNLYHILQTFAVFRLYIAQVWKKSFQFKRAQNYHIRLSAGSVEAEPFIHPDRNP